VVLLPIPYEGTTTYGAGCRRGPGAIIEASANMELYDEELLSEPCVIGIHTSPPLDVVDDAEEMVERIEAVSAFHLDRGKFVTLLGGEHTVTLGLVRALRPTHKRMSVLCFDAHADLRESYRGNRYSHACVGRRVSELCDLVQVGIRSLSAPEAQALDDRRISTFWASEFRGAQDPGRREALIERVIGRLNKEVYVSIDVDAFDPSVMPAVGTPEPGGLGWEDVLAVLRAVARERTVIGLDLVELAPVAGLVYPEFTAAKLLYKTWGYVFGAQAPG
jgi:agmatinase